MKRVAAEMSISESALKRWRAVGSRKTNGTHRDSKPAKARSHAGARSRANDHAKPAPYLEALIDDVIVEGPPSAIAELLRALKR
jgi:hypothetical protein